MKSALNLKKICSKKVLDLRFFFFFAGNEKPESKE